MFRSVIQKNSAEKLRIGFIVQNKSNQASKLSSILTRGLFEYAHSINMSADIKVLSAKEALAKLSELDGLFISGKHVFSQRNHILPAEQCASLAALLVQAVADKMPVLSTSNGFAQMNNALLTNAGVISTKPTTFSPFFVKAVPVISLQSRQGSRAGFKVRESTDKKVMTVEFKTYGLLGRMLPGNHHQHIQLENKQAINKLSTQLVAEAFDGNDAIVAFSLASKESYYLAVNWKFVENKSRSFLNGPLIKSFVLASRKFNKKQVLINN